MPDVSVVIPTHDRAHMVGDAVASCLRESDGGLSVQVVVVDDASSDDTHEVLAAGPSGVEVVRLDENVGAAEARNVGFERCRGEYVKFLDSDDVLLPGALAAEVAVACEKSADMVVSGWEVVTLGPRGEVLPDRTKVHPAPTMEPVVEAVLAGRASATSAVLYRRSYVDGIRWDGSVEPIDDWDFFVRAALAGGSIQTLDRSTYRMRHHGGPRVTSGGMLRYARAHHEVLARMERWLRDHDALTPERSRRLAQYYYKQLRVLCVHDREAFHRAADHVLELDPDFAPVEEERQPWMRVLGRLLGFRRALLAHTFVKRLAGRA